MGAVYLQNGVCLLPKTDDHKRRLKIIENDINEMSGESVLLETVALDRAQEDKVVAAKARSYTVIRNDLTDAASDHYPVLAMFEVQP